ncbi:MAG TPA: hypothetical protein DCQ36_10175 [Actinobacteria bacterium]|nr:hypothetical protein [Actinomycetota bacterium]
MSGIGRITLAPFGSLDDLEFTWAPGLTVVHGSNEAGKTTLLHALDAVISGLPAASVHGVLPRSLGVTFSITEADGSITDLRRTLTGVVSEPRMVPVDEPWQEALNGWGPWRRTHGLDHAALRAGGAELFTGQGDLADVIFASHEGFSARRVKERLVARAEALFKARRGSRSEISAALDDLQEARERLASATIDPARMALLASEHAVAQHRVEHAQAARDASAQLHRALERDLRALTFVDRVLRLQHQIATLAATALMDPRDAEQVMSLLADLQSDRTERSALPEQIEDLSRSIENSPARDAILDHAAGIRAGAEDLARQLERREQASSLRLEEAESRTDVRDLLLRLGVELADAEGPDEAALAAPVLVSDDVRAALDARADDVQRARVDVDHAQRGRRAAEADLEERREQLSAVDAADPGALVEARRTRDSLWTRVVSALATPLDPQEQHDLVSAYADATQIADDTADELAARAHADATLAELLRRVQQAARVETERVADAAEAERRWQDVAVRAGLPPAVTDEAWPTRRDLLTALGTATRALSSTARRAHELEEEWQRFAHDIDELGTLLGVDGTTQEQVAELAKRLDIAREARETLEANEKERTRLNDLSSRLDDRIAERSGALDEIRRRGGFEPEVDLREPAQRTLDHAAAIAEAAEARAPLVALFDSDSAVDEALGRLTHVTEESLREDLEFRRSELAEREATLESAKDARRETAAALRAAEESDTAFVEAQQVSSARSRLADLVDEYARTVVQIRLLDDRLDALLRTQGSTTLERAGELLEALTGGRYVALSSREGHDGRRTLLVHRRDQSPAEIGELSEGTADQVYLALRLAGLDVRLAQQQEHGVRPLPIVLDDVLLAFDDDRTAYALTALAQWSEGKQVILTTHHDHVRAVAAAQAVPVVPLPTPAPIASLGDPSDIRRSAAAPRLASAGPRREVTRAEKLQLIREWCAAEGIPVPAKRIPKELEARFDAEHPDLVLS